MLPGALEHFVGAVLGVLALLTLIAGGVWAARYLYLGYRRVKAQADQAFTPAHPHERGGERPWPGR